nr:MULTISPECIES: nitrous oxide reductase accessory protein NosL [Halorubrum]
MAGCLGGSAEQTPDPVDLSGQKTDYQGGMVIGDHGGPNGQVFYANMEPEPRQGPVQGPDGTENLAWFHTLAHGLFPYHFDMVDTGAEATAMYVTDYSRVDWELAEEAERKTMPAPTAPETFSDATRLTYVVGSSVMGGMGPDLIPFSETDAAERLAETHGGQTIEYDDIDRTLIEGIRMTGMG